MATDDPAKTDPPADPPEDDPEGTDPPEDDPEGEEKDKKDPPQDPELAKAIRRRDSALARAKKAEEERDALKAKHEGDKTDPVLVANRRLVRAEAKTVLVASGITDAGDQKVVMDVLGLDDVSVDNDGTVDTDAIQDRVDDLKRVFGGKGSSTTKRTPRVDTRDKGGNGAKERDPASQRRREMLGYR